MAQSGAPTALALRGSAFVALVVCFVFLSTPFTASSFGLSGIPLAFLGGFFTGAGFRTLLVGLPMSYL